MMELQHRTELTGTARIESAIAYFPFDEAKKALEKGGYKIISLKENAGLRMLSHAGSDIHKGNFVREGVIYLPTQHEIFLTENSPIMLNPKEATKAHTNQSHRSAKEYFLTEWQTEQAMEGAVKFPNKPIPTNRLGEEEITAYAFGKNAKAYGDFLHDFGVDEFLMRIDNYGLESKLPQGYITEYYPKSFLARPLIFVGINKNDTKSGGLQSRCIDRLSYPDKKIRGIKILLEK